MEKLNHRMRWKAFFELNPETKSKSKETFGFKSTAPAPYVPELKEFQDKMINLAKNITFGNKPNHFQQKLRADEQRIKNESKAHIKADKSTNFYQMEGRQYNEMLEKEINKEYKKAQQQTVTSITNEHKRIVSNLDLDSRVFATTQRQAFVTVKDHKENFQNNPSCRLINPSKPEIGRIAKKILEKCNSTIRKRTGLKQWKNTQEVVNWFKNIERKNCKKFIQFDVVNFYPSITEKLLRESINWARTYVDISVEEEDIIIQAKKSLLFKDGQPWAKKGNTNFDVGMGSYDGAETCELVGLYILADLDKLDRIDIGIYRDDCAGETSAPPRQVEVLKKKITAIFGKHDLKVTADANLKVINFLDVTLDLEQGTFKPYMKPNNNPLYVHKLSNHPPLVTKNIPAGVNKRLSCISSNKEIFQAAAPAYQEALARSGYDYKLEFDPRAAEPSKKKRNRKRNICWFNPPYSTSVKTNVGAEFLKLVDKCFPPYNPLSKIFNRSTLKLSYRCTPNMETIIAARNAKILSPPVEETRSCNCEKNTNCPLDGQCLTNNLVYQSTVTQHTAQNTQRTYIGLTSTTFKARLGVHKNSFKDPEANQTSLSKHIWDLKKKNIDYTVTWKLIDRARPFSPVTGVCGLCIKEKFYIMFRPSMANLNSRSEIYANCRHKHSVLLIKRERKSKSKNKRTPGS